MHPRADDARDGRGLSSAACPIRGHRAPRSSCACSARRSWCSWSARRSRPSRGPPCTARGCRCWRSCSRSSGRSCSRSRAAGRPTAAACGVVAASALGLTILQPDGAGFLALYMTLGIICVQLRPQQALLGFVAGVVAISAIHVLTDDQASVSDVLVGDAVGTLFFVMGYGMRASRQGLQQAQETVAELEATREAHAQAVQLRERARLAREMHDVLAHSLSALTVQLEGARLLARSRGARPGRDGRDRAQPRPRPRRAGGGAAGDRRAARRGPCPGPERLPALAEAFREQTDIDCDLAFDGTPRELELRGPPGRVPHRAGGADQRAPSRAPGPRRRCACATSPTARGWSSRTSAPTVTPGPSRPSASPAWATGSPACASARSCSAGASPRRRRDTGFRVELFIPEGTHGG